jgi:hypothetical protein
MVFFPDMCLFTGLNFTFWLMVLKDEVVLTISLATKEAK